MGYPTKGTRKISVKNVDYRWYLSRNADTVFVFPDGGARSMMSMKLPWKRLSKAYKLEERSKVPVTPKDVRHAILHALNCGWDPTKDEPFKTPPITPKYQDLISFFKEQYYQEVLDEGFRTTP